MDVNAEQEFAKQNYERITKLIPIKIIEKENDFHAKFLKIKASPLKKLSFFYSEINEFFNFVHKFTPCKKGCSACCYYEVTISEIEICHIENNTNFKRNKIFAEKNKFHGTKCPFLLNNVCSIYEHRPFVCRRHKTLTPTNQWCIAENALSHKFHNIEFTEINRTYDLIRIEGKAKNLWDIRQVFSDKVSN